MNKENAVDTLRHLLRITEEGRTAEPSDIEDFVESVIRAAMDRIEKESKGQS